MNTHAVVCNETEGSKSVAPGALCFVRQYSSETVGVLVDVVNRDGLWISLWRPYTSLTNFRTKFIPTSHPKHLWARPLAASKAKIEAMKTALDNAVASQPLEEAAE